MKLYFLAGVVVIVLALLVILSPGQTNTVEEPTTLVTPTANVLMDGQFPHKVADDNSAGLTTYTVFVVDDEFSPSVMYANKGDTVRLTFATGHERPKDSDVEVAFDFTLEDFGVSSYVDTAQELEFVADKTGEFTYYCLTCSPQISGIFVVN